MEQYVNCVTWYLPETSDEGGHYANPAAFDRPTLWLIQWDHLYA